MLDSDEIIYDSADTAIHLHVQACISNEYFSSSFEALWKLNKIVITVTVILPNFLMRQYSLFSLRQNFTDNIKTWLTLKLGFAMLHSRLNLCRCVLFPHLSQNLSSDIKILLI